MKIICGNCGINGHVYRNCNTPITSLGIIAFKIINDENYYLMIRRKDTLGYIEFIRGKYDVYDTHYIIKLFKEMTNDEINRILENNFDFLWKELWITNNKKITTEYKNSKRKFLKIKKDDISKIIKIIGIFWDETEWGFPKGRRNLKETNINCAMREFKEETGYEEEDIKIINDIELIEEDFYGSNNIHYKHLYFIAESQNEKQPKIDNTNKLQISEVSNIGWFPYKTALELLRPYNKEKKNALINIELFLKKKNLGNKTIRIK